MHIFSIRAETQRICNDFVVEKGITKAGLQFFELLTPEQRASIRCVSADGANWIAACIQKYCPNAERCADPFHVVSWATEALDKERRSSPGGQGIAEAQQRPSC